MKKNTSFVLGLESSCDDTAASVLCYDGSGNLGNVEILSSIVLNQHNLHQDFRGIVPEIAARAHNERLDSCTQKAIKEAKINVEDIRLISVTSGPGLIGGLLSGIMFAKGLSHGLICPLVGVNHLAAHCLSVKMIHSLEFPYLTLLVSGGHCQFLIVEDFDKFLRLGGTIDDAPGECFDKIAASLGLGYPGGPEIEKYSSRGNKDRFPFPKPMLERKDCNMSFSGLKTAVKRKIDELLRNQGGLYKEDINDICASFQNSVIEIFKKKSHYAMTVFQRYYGISNNNYALVGGVAANKAISRSLEETTSNNKFQFFSVPQKFCTDNAAMIGYLGAQRFFADNYKKEDLVAKPRWPLDIRAKPMLGFGKRGVKA